MRSTRRRIAAAGLLATVAISFAAGCGGDDDENTTAATTAATATAPATTAPSTTAPSTSTTGGELDAQAQQYVQDASDAARALAAFGGVIQSAGSLQEFRGKIGEARQTIGRFDAAVKKLQGYTLDNPTLEQQRAGLARTGPAVTDVMRRFVDTARTGDEDDLRALVPDIQKAIGDFQSAATSVVPGADTTP